MLEFLRLAKGSIAAGGGEGNGPGAVDAMANRIIRIRVRSAIEFDLVARSQNNNAALGRCQLQRTVKRNGFGAVQQVEARAAKAPALRKRNGAGNALARMLVDQHDVGLAGSRVTKRAQPGLGCAGHNGLQLRTRECSRNISKRGRRKAAQLDRAIRAIERAGHLVDGKHRDARGHHASHRFRCGSTNKRCLGQNKRLIAAAINGKRSIGNRGLVTTLILKSLGRYKIKVDLRARELGRHALDGHGVAGPFGVGMVQDGDGTRGAASRKERRHAIHIAHELAKVWPLWVIAVRVKVRRAVPIGKGRHAKRMRRKPINTADEHVVGDPLHLAQALVPAKGAKDLGHAAPMLFGVEARGRRAQLGKRVRKELRVPRAVEVAVAPTVDTGGKLVDDHVDTGHVLPCDRAEVVPSALTQTRVTTLVFDYMSDVHDAVRVAPIADLLVKARTVELRGDVHVDVADPRAVCLVRPKAV